MLNKMNITTDHIHWRRKQLMVGGAKIIVHSAIR